MNICIVLRILFNMTYEEYKNKKSNKGIIKTILSKLFTVILFTMIIIILSNYSPKFKKFIVNDVLNSTLDFSKFNRVIGKFTNVFDNKKVMNVSSNIDIGTKEKYKEGYKYKLNGNDLIYVKDSGIVTYIGNKEGYNNTIIIQQSNGYYAWYGNVSEKVKLYDYVEKGSILGNAKDEYYFVLYKDDKVVNED